MLPFLWTKQKLISLIRKSLIFWYGFDILIMFSLFEHTVKKNWKSSWKYFNNYHQNIKFTHEFSKESIPFLDLKASLSGGQLTTDLHIKLQKNISTCTIHLLIQTIPNVPLFFVKLWGLAGQAIIKQILKDIWTIWNHGSKQEAIINFKPKSKWAKVDLIKKIAKLNKVNLKGVTFLVTHHPLLKSFQQILINKHLNTLYLDVTAKEVFMPGSMVTFRSIRKLSSYLVRAKLYPLERVTALCKCHGKLCAMWLNFKETLTFTSSVTHETFKINHTFDCNTQWLIYLFTGKQCPEQYAGQTIDDFRFRWNNYKDNNRKY